MSATVFKLGASALAVSLAYLTLPAPQANQAPQLAAPNQVAVVPAVVTAPLPELQLRQAAVVQLVAAAPVEQLEAAPPRARVEKRVQRPAPTAIAKVEESGLHLIPAGQDPTFVLQAGAYTPEQAKKADDDALNRRVKAVRAQREKAALEQQGTSGTPFVP